jgi:hypothetical protein
MRILTNADGFIQRRWPDGTTSKTFLKQTNLTRIDIYNYIITID